MKDGRGVFLSMCFHEPIMGHFVALAEHAIVAHSTVLVAALRVLRWQEARAIRSTLDFSYLRPVPVCTFNAPLSYA